MGETPARVLRYLFLVPLLTVLVLSACATRQRRFSFRRPLFRLSSEPTSHSNSEPSIASRPQKPCTDSCEEPINRRRSLDSHRFRQPKFLQHLTQLRRKTLSRVSIDGH